MTHRAGPDRRPDARGRRARAAGAGQPLRDRAVLARPVRRGQAPHGGLRGSRIVKPPQNLRRIERGVNLYLTQTCIFGFLSWSIVSGLKRFLK